MKLRAIVPRVWRDKYDRWHFSPAVASGGFLYVSGCTGTRPDGTIATDVRSQIRQTFKTAETSLVEAGVSFDDVVELVSYHVGIEDSFDEFCQAKDEFIGEPYPAWTAVGVSGLAASGAVVEIKVTAKL